MQKHLNGMPSMERSLNPFNKIHPKSVFNESSFNSANSNYSIPQNKELFDFVIREAFSDMLVSLDDLKMSEKEMADSIFNKIRERYVNRVKRNGPTKAMLDAK